MTDPTAPWPDPATGSAAGPAYPAGPTADLPATNVLSIVALVLSLVFAPAGIVTGHIALAQIKRSGEAGHGLALAATIIGYVLTAVSILLIIVFVGLVASGVGAVTSTTLHVN
jgi:hypothetical protein